MDDSVTSVLASATQRVATSSPKLGANSTTNAKFTVSPTIAFLGWIVSLCYRLAFFVIALVTYHIPRWTIAVLSWGGVISLEFNAIKLFIIFVAFGIATSWAIKVRYLNKYSKLRETPLRTDEKLDLHPDVATSSTSTGINNYLDEFLSAIKVFGYLEKPVFHELARHLQTRRCIAGETVSLDSSDFYVVVDGSMQVFAQIKGGTSNDQAPDDDDEDENNGFQLLNEVESGGTLSSLFTILRLFTEDVRLRYEEVTPSPATSQQYVPPMYLEMQGTQQSRRQSPNPGQMRQPTKAVQMDKDRSRKQPSRLRNSFSSTERPNMTAMDFSSSDLLNEAPDKEVDFSTNASPLSRTSGGGKISPLPPGLGRQTPYRRRDSLQTEVPLRESRQIRHALENTIARAKVDATLAVIPAEAFKRLTKKFPKASANIVQVILTRLHRVTFYTAHSYLGLTKELVKTEKAINELANYPLPAEFYESGGIARLRQRFMPETAAASRDTEDAKSDYFSAEKRKSSFPAITPYMAPGLGRSMHSESRTHISDAAVRLNFRKASAPASGAASQSALSIKLKDSTPQSSPAGSPVSASKLLTPLHRSREDSMTSHHPRISRNVGDILSMTSLDQASVSLSSSPDKGSIALPLIDDASLMRPPRLASRNFSFAMDAADAFDLRDAVMTSISKSIGLIQPTTSVPASTETSPLLQPADHSTSLKRAVFGSSFGSLSYLGLQGPDDESVTVSSVLGASYDSQDIENETEILYFPRGSVLAKAGERGPGLYYVIDGWLDVMMPAKELDNGSGIESLVNRMDSLPHSTLPNAANARVKATAMSQATAPVASQATASPSALTPPSDSSRRTSKVLFSVKPGGIAGYLSSLSGFPSYVDIVAKTDVYVGFLPARSLERIMDRQPIVLLTLAKRLISLLPPLVVHIDSALDWMQVNAGQVIYRHGEKSDSFYFVNQGRLRSIVEKEGSGGIEILAEYGQGDSVGELDCITSMPRPSTLHAIRDSELTRMPMALFNAMAMVNPSITVQISRIIGQRVRRQMEAKRNSPLLKDASELGRANFNLKTVAIIPVTYQIPVSEFATRLKQSLEDIGAPTSYLNQATIMHVQGRHAFSKMGKLKLAGWLSETEQKYRIVLYVADTAVASPWTQTCIRQADCVLLVAHAAGDPSIGEYERLLLSMKTTARKELVLLHHERAIPPGSTRPWLQTRPWVHAWSHCEMSDVPPHRVQAFVPDIAPVLALKQFKDKVQVQLDKYRRNGASAPKPHRAGMTSDFARLARRLCGKSIGVIMGGGGARGLSHIGVLRAFLEEGIPVDMIGGTSIGSFVGGLYAREGDLVSTLGRAKRFAGRMSSLWRILSDVTYPITAYTTGHEFNRGIYKSFYDYHIEDMWLSFFCNTTNITHSRMDIHTTGYAWRYIRASMTLIGLLPPLSDEGQMLVDGGYTDNLPVSVMLSMGANSVFAIDVGSIDDTSAREFGETVSGWWVLINRWNPWSYTRHIPSITEIQSRLTYVSSVKTLEEAKSTPGVLYMRMPVEQYGTMQFNKFNEMEQVGYVAAKRLIASWRKQGKIPTGMVDTGGAQTGEDKRSGRPNAGKPLRRNSI